MKKILLGVASLFFISVLQSFAIYEIPNEYDTYEILQQEEDLNVCEQVTDGCNLWEVEDGEKSTPIRLCKLTEEFEYKWSCAQEKNTSDFEIMTTSFPIETTMPAPINYKIYATQFDFELSEGLICSSASDGVNTFMMKDGKVFAGTKMGYPNDFIAQWKCNNYISDSIIGWSQSDKNEYNTLMERTSEREERIVKNALTKFDIILKAYPESQQEIVLDAFLERIDTLVGDIIMSYPQDIALPDDISSIYSMLRYLRYDLVVYYSA